MTPVVNPWIFYIMPLCENVSLAFEILSAASGIAMFILLIYYFVESWNLDEDEIVKLKRLGKMLVVVFIITLFISCLIPSEETLTKMIIANNITVDRVNAVSDTVVTVYNDIMELFKNAGDVNG